MKQDRAPGTEGRKKAEGIYKGDFSIDSHKLLTCVHGGGTVEITSESGEEYIFMAVPGGHPEKVVMVTKSNGEMTIIDAKDTPSNDTLKLQKPYDVKPEQAVDKEPDDAELLKRHDIPSDHTVHNQSGGDSDMKPFFQTGDIFGIPSDHAAHNQSGGGSDMNPFFQIGDIFKSPDGTSYEFQVKKIIVKPGTPAGRRRQSDPTGFERPRKSYDHINAEDFMTFVREGGTIVFTNLKSGDTYTFRTVPHGSPHQIIMVIKNAKDKVNGDMVVINEKDITPVFSVGERFFWKLHEEDEKVKPSSTIDKIVTTPGTKEDEMRYREQRLAS